LESLGRGGGQREAKEKYFECNDYCYNVLNEHPTFCEDYCFSEEKEAQERRNEIILEIKQCVLQNLNDEKLLEEIKHAL